MMKNVKEIYCGFHFTAYTNTESLCCTFETNTMLYVNYSSIKIFLIIKKKKNGGKHGQFMEEEETQMTNKCTKRC